MSYENAAITRLSNGLTVITDPIPHLETASIAIINPVGTRFEHATNNGIAHFYEHMAFKDTTTRSALRINTDIENLGGDANAFTDYEMTVFVNSVMAHHAHIGLDVVSDMILNPIFPKKEISTERKVILEEVAMYNDDPTGLVGDLIMQSAYGDTPMGRPILGTPANLRRMGRDDLASFWENFYNRSNLIIAASGEIEPQKIIDQANELFQHKKPKEILAPIPAHYVGGALFKQKQYEQINLNLAFKGVSAKNHADVYAMAAVGKILGGGMSSRLYQEVREKRGLAYSIGSGIRYFNDSGLLIVGAGTSKKNISECVGVLCDVLSAAGGNTPFTDEEVIRAKNQLYADEAKKLEKPESRIENLVSDFIDQGRVISMAETRNKIDALTPQILADMAQNILSSAPSVAAVGPIKSMTSYDDICQRLKR